MIVFQNAKIRTFLELEKKNAGSGEKAGKDCSHSSRSVGEGFTKISKAA
jgi:hypothetical protein